MKDNISPEEKLLRLIRGEKKPKPAYVSQQEIATLPKNAAYSLVRARLSHRAVQKLTLILMAASFGCLLFSFIYSLVGSKKIVLPSLAAGKTEELKFTPKEEPKPYEFYLEAARGRQIFQGASGNLAGQQAPVVKPAAEEGLIKQINLVGIIWGDNPQAIIEDKNIQKTYYLSKGQFIGEIKIEDIQESKIILNYKGQKLELYL